MTNSKEKKMFQFIFWSRRKRYASKYIAYLPWAWAGASYEEKSEKLIVKDFIKFCDEYKIGSEVLKKH